MSDIMESVGVTDKLARENVKLLAEIERLQAGIADMRHTIDQFGREDANKVAEIRRTRIWALEKVISKKVAQIRRMQAAMLDAILLLSEAGLSADEKCEVAYERLCETYDGDA